MIRNANNARIIPGCAYRLSPKKTSPHIFKLLRVSGDGKRVQICNINTQAVDFWRPINDLHWVDSSKNNELAETLTSEVTA